MFRRTIIQKCTSSIPQREPFYPVFCLYCDRDSSSPCRSDQYAFMPRYSMGSVMEDSENGEDEDHDFPTDYPALGLMSRYLVKLPDSASDLPDRNLVYTRHVLRPAVFKHGIDPRMYKPLPPLRMSLPIFPRVPFPVGSKQEVKSRQASMLLRRQTTAFHAMCSKPPKHPMEELLYQSCETLRRHYESLSELCHQ
ncbi:hypothetical protein ElyMa_006592500 [Elysia marginata]|uniref:Uncharacterized protein n=1 Tax=Elysia marginata TaxID=1093978 RepID=A0AAV4IEY7_9GAST|nr:hypothetical protein ElyMa_006592500 [Elysia marginata]